MKKRPDVMAVIESVVAMYFRSETDDGKSWQRDSRKTMTRLRDLVRGEFAGPMLAWLRNLPEAGSITDLAAKEADLLERRRGLLVQIGAIDERLEDLRAEAERMAAKHWPASEVAAAKTG